MVLKRKKFFMLCFLYDLKDIVFDFFLFRCFNNNLIDDRESRDGWICLDMCRGEGF